jgi:hypothetical protein
MTVAGRRHRTHSVTGRAKVSALEVYSKFVDASTIVGSAVHSAQDILLTNESGRSTGFVFLDFVESYIKQDVGTAIGFGAPLSVDIKEFPADAATVTGASVLSGLDIQTLVDASLISGLAVPSSVNVLENAIASVVAGFTIAASVDIFSPIDATASIGFGIPSFIETYIRSDSNTAIGTGVASSIEEYNHQSLSTITSTGTPTSTDHSDYIDNQTIIALSVIAESQSDSATATGFSDITRSFDNYTIPNDALQPAIGFASMSAVEIPTFDADIASGLAVLFGDVSYGRSDVSTVIGTGLSITSDSNDRIESGTAISTGVPSATSTIDTTDTGTMTNSGIYIGTPDAQGYDIGMYEYSVYDYGPGLLETGTVIGVATGQISAVEGRFTSASGTLLFAAEQLNSGTINTDIVPLRANTFTPSVLEAYNNQLVRGTATGQISGVEVYTTGPGGGGGSFVIGAPRNWGKLISDGGHRPSLSTYVPEPGIIFGPDVAYYNNAAARSVLRGQPRNDLPYYPRQLGWTVSAIQAGTHLTITLALRDDNNDGTPETPHNFVVGDTIILNDLVGKGATGKLVPKVDGTYHVLSVSGNNVTFTEPWTGTGTYDSKNGGYATKVVKNDTVYEIIVTPSNIASAGDNSGAGGAFVPYFTKGVGAASTSNPWVWTGGKTHRFIIDGVTEVDTSFPIRIPSNLDVFNPSTEYLTNGASANPGLYNPFSTLQFGNCWLDFQGGSAQATCGGTMAYSQNLGGFYLPQGESISYQGVTGLMKGMINHAFAYDANKIGGGCKNFQWKNCFNYRNELAAAGGGGHTDCYQVFDMDNSELYALGLPTWEYVFMQSGGNSMMFLNDAAGSGTGIIDGVWAKNCIAWRGNKFADLAGSNNVGARGCWCNKDKKDVAPGTDPGTPVVPDFLDFGSGEPGVHPFPTGSLIWPTALPNANLEVDRVGNTTIAPRVLPVPLHYDDNVNNIHATSTFTYTE